MTSNSTGAKLCARVDGDSLQLCGAGCGCGQRRDVAGVEYAANAANLAGDTAMRGAGVAREPQLPQPLLEELLPNLTLQFALVPEGENTFPALTSLHIQQVEGVHAVAWQPTRLCSMTLTSGSHSACRKPLFILIRLILPAPKGCYR